MGLFWQIFKTVKMHNIGAAPRKEKTKKLYIYKKKVFFMNE